MKTREEIESGGVSNPSDLPVMGYDSYFDTIFESLTSFAPNDTLGKILSNYLTSIRQARDNIGSGLLLHLGDDHLREFGARWRSLVSKANPIEVLEMTLAAVAAFIAETSLANQGEFNLSSSRYGAALSSEIASYNAWLVAENRTGGMRRGYAQTLDEFESRTRETLNGTADLITTGHQALAELKAANATALKELAEARLEVDRGLSFFKSTMASSQGEFQSALQDYQNLKEEVSVSQANVDAFKAALREEAKIEAAKMLWDDRATAASVGFRRSAFLLIVMLFVLPILGFIFLDSVIGVLRHISEATLIGIDQSNAQGGVLLGLAVNRIVIVTVPLALYFWAVRILVRFNLRSQILMDARQRHTMMNTYFHLIERQSAVKEDRALILNALFRPTPGQQNDSVDPPNFTDLVEKTMGR